MMFVTKYGMVLNAETIDVPVQGRRSAGVKGIALNGDDQVIFAAINDESGELIIVSELGYGKRVILGEFGQSKRYRKGTKVMDTDLSRGPIVFADIVQMPYLVAFFYDNEESEVVQSEFIDIQGIADIGSYLPMNRNARIISAGKHRTN